MNMLFIWIFIKVNFLQKHTCRDNCGWMRNIQLLFNN